MPMKSGRRRAASVPPGIGLLRSLEWNHRAIKCVAFDPGLHKLAGGCLNGTVTVWDTATGRLLRTFERRRSTFEWQRSEVACVAFDPAGQRHDIPGLLAALFHHPRAAAYVDRFSDLARAAATAVRARELRDLAGVVNEVGSMITGRYVVRPEPAK